MKLVKVMVYVETAEHVTDEEVLEWVDETLTKDWNAQPRRPGFEMFQTAIELPK